jgi:hypothetical protein
VDAQILLFAQGKGGGVGEAAYSELDVDPSSTN